MKSLTKGWVLIVFLLTFFTLSASLEYGSQMECKQDVFHTTYSILLCNEALAQPVEEPEDEESQQLESLDGLSDEEIVDIYLNKPWLLPSELTEAEWEKIRNLVHSPEAEEN